jgi:hypothetical protein
MSQIMFKTKPKTLNMICHLNKKSTNKAKNDFCPIIKLNRFED